MTAITLSWPLTAIFTNWETSTLHQKSQRSGPLLYIFNPCHVTSHAQVHDGTLLEPLSIFPFLSFLCHSSTLIWRDRASNKTINMKANAREQSDLALATHHLGSFTPTWLWLFRNRKGVSPWKTGANESNAGRELFGSAFLPSRLGFLFGKPTNSVRTLLCNHEQRLCVPASLSGVINGARPLARLALPALQIFPWYLMNSDKLLFSHCVPPSLLSPSLSSSLFLALFKGAQHKFTTMAPKSRSRRVLMFPP